MANYCHLFVESLNLDSDIKRNAIELEDQVHIKSLLYRLAEIFKPGYPNATEQQIQLAAGYGYCVHQSLFLADDQSAALMLACDEKLQLAIPADNQFWQKKQQLDQQGLWSEQQISDVLTETFSSDSLNDASLEKFESLQIRHRSYGLFFPLILQAFSVDEKISTKWCIDLIGYYLKIFGYIYDADAILEPNAETTLQKTPVYSVIIAKSLLLQHQLNDIAQDNKEVIKTVFASGIYQAMMEQAIEQCKLGNLHLDNRPDLPVTRGRMLFRAFNKKCRQQIKSVAKMYD